MPKPVAVTHSHWLHHFDGLQVSAKEFYDSVEEVLKTKQLPSVYASRISYAEGGLFSNRREYLRISCKEYVFDICAAPYGTGFFVSWWLGETGNPALELISRVPLIGGFIARNATKRTRFQMDTESMFKEGVRQALMEAIDSVTALKGLRALSESERRPEVGTLRT